VFLSSPTQLSVYIKCTSELFAPLTLTFRFSWLTPSPRNPPDSPPLPCFPPQISPVFSSARMRKVDGPNAFPFPSLQGSKYCLSYHFNGEPCAISHSISCRNFLPPTITRLNPIGFPCTGLSFWFFFIVQDYPIAPVPPAPQKLTYRMRSRALKLPMITSLSFFWFPQRPPRFKEAGVRTPGVARTPCRAEVLSNGSGLGNRRPTFSFFGFKRTILPRFSAFFPRTASPAYSCHSVT